MNRLGIVTALMAEAIVLIDFYRLKKQARSKLKRSRSFQLFQSDEIQLLVTGPGAKAIIRCLNDYFTSRKGDSPQKWLNVGVAGSRDHSIGDLIWADKIAGVKIGMPKGEGNNPQIKVLSLSNPSTDYQAHCLFDMEAEAILQMIQQNLAQFTPGDLFCAKVISDNQRANGHDFDKLWVTSLLRKQVKTLDYHINKFIKS